MRPWHRFIHPIQRYFRRKRGARLLQRYPNLANLKICDLGGSRHFWEESGLPLGNIVILNVSEGETQAYSEEYDGLKIALYDGRHIPAADDEYELLICNSVIEHVEPSQHAALCAEMRRVARQVYLQTPAFEFPIEPHFVFPFIHWLPPRLGEVAARISPWCLLAPSRWGSLHEEFSKIKLLKRAEVRALFPSAEITGEKFFGFQKSHLVFWTKTEVRAR